MTNKEINIAITGFAGTGKSTILEIIAKALTDAGFKTVIVSDSETETPLNTRITSLIESELKINLGTHQTMRSCHTD